MREKSIELLNKAVADELSAVHQYMYFHFHCDDQGFDLLANLFKRTAIEEMMHIEKLAERILFLKGEVEIKASFRFENYEIYFKNYTNDVEKYPSDQVHCLGITQEYFCRSRFWGRRSTSLLAG